MDHPTSLLWVELQGAFWPRLSQAGRPEAMAGEQAMQIPTSSLFLYPLEGLSQILGSL